MKRVLIVAYFVASALGCAAARYHGEGRPIESYDYCVIDREEADYYFEPAASILGESFVVLEKNDPRLEISSVREKACNMSISWARGFWTTTGWVEVSDYETGDHVMTTQTRRGVLWMGAHGDVMESIHDVAAARAAGPPLPASARNVPLPAKSTNTRQPGSVGGRSMETRLAELESLRTKGLITQKEYDQQRKSILDDL